MPTSGNTYVTGGPGGADGMNQIIVEQVNKARTYQPKPQDGQPSEGQFRKGNWGSSDRRCQPDGAVSDNQWHDGLNDRRESLGIAPSEHAAAGVEHCRQQDRPLTEGVAVGQSIYLDPKQNLLMVFRVALVTKNLYNRCAGKFTNFNIPRRKIPGDRLNSGDFLCKMPSLFQSEGFILFNGGGSKPLLLASREDSQHDDRRCGYQLHSNCLL
jgi:hypothetical protein